MSVRVSPAVDTMRSMAVIKAETLDAETREALIEKAETLRMRLGLEDPIVATIEQASTQLGLQAELRGLSPVDKANAAIAHGALAASLPSADPAGLRHRHHHPPGAQSPDGQCGPALAGAGGGA